MREMIKRTVLSIMLSSWTLMLAAQCNPGGVASPSVWFQTVPVTGDLNGAYHWEDKASGKSVLFKSGSTEEPVFPRSDMHTYNFNPAMPFDSTISQEFLVKGTDLSQRTVIAVVGAKREEANKDGFLYHIKGNPHQVRVLSKTKVIRTMREGKKSYTYNPSLLSRKDTAERVKILSYLEAQKPDRSIWKSGGSARINIGGKFDRMWTMGDSALTSDVDSLVSSRFYLPELTVYPRFLRPGERLRIESYLALKYGITLNSIYISPEGTILWNDGTYKYRIAGYGKDGRSGFDQEKSTTSYEEAAYDIDDTYHQGNSNLKSSAYNLLEVGFSENTTIPNGSYIIYADNNKPTIVDTIENRVDTIDYTDSLKVMRRIWKVQTFGVDKSYTHRIELGYKMIEDSTFALYRDSSAYLLVDRSGSDNFKVKVDTILMDELDEERSKIIFNDVRFDSLCYFTFAYSGVPKQESAHEKYDYFLNMKDPTCNGYNSNSDGELNLSLPASENGFYYEFKQMEQGGGENLSVAYDSIDLTGIANGNYYLTVLPVNSRTIDFDGTGVTLVNVNFINNSGAISWALTDVSAESKVAFVNINENTANDGVFRYGVRISNGKLNVIEDFVLNHESVDVKENDVIRIDRNSQNSIVIFKNDVVIGNCSIASDCTFKFAVRTNGGNVSKVSLENFNWGRGVFPNFFFNQYQAQGVFAYSNQEVSAYPTGFMRYLVDFDVRCWERNDNSGSSNMQIVTDLSSRSFTATVTLDKPSYVTFFVYTLNNVLVSEKSTYAYNGTASKSFSLNIPGEFFVIAVTSDGRKFDGRTLLK